jgi:hypothetical protein
METWLVKSLAERKLGKVSGYRSPGIGNGLSVEITSGMRLRDGEIVVGVYELPADLLQPVIVLTDVGLHIGFETGWQTIDYEDLKEVHGPDTVEEISGVRVELRNGDVVAVPVRGAHQQFRDAFPFLQFLRGVLSVSEAR